LEHEKLLLGSLRAVAGVTIDLCAVDVLDGEKTRELFSNLEHPVAGIFYVAVRLNDQVFSNLKTEEDWKSGKYICFSPHLYDVKIKGVEILLEAVNPRSLDFLVLTSSMASLFGSPGQANYAAAQTHMEALVKDLPNTVIVTFPPIVSFQVRTMSTVTYGLADRRRRPCREFTCRKGYATWRSTR
ncbi:KR domain-containing protein, partial [Melanogaster broomeanus]